MTMRSRIIVKDNRIMQVGRELLNAAESVVAKVALDMEAEAKMSAPVDTGNLKNSIAASRIGGAAWEVIAGAEYAAYVEYGTSRGAPAQPYFTPAYNRAADNLDSALAQIARRIG